MKYLYEGKVFDFSKYPVDSHNVFLNKDILNDFSFFIGSFYIDSNRCPPVWELDAEDIRKFDEITFEKITSTLTSLNLHTEVKLMTVKRSGGWTEISQAKSDYYNKQRNFLNS
ncbi:hypothetical protein R6242_16300 [Iodobacter sp. CM08]|uniref:hypothetical protein n=1 Tax=Iodobacter sp. CM08 TaxID=3085902 RepID=UPI00298168F6|nr:hypothetical protein [Iodobacter sp. CM08]MDW5418129.1 hypothetical protein [Iodobacter sp. CM08]